MTVVELDPGHTGDPVGCREAHGELGFGGPDEEPAAVFTFTEEMPEVVLDLVDVVEPSAPSSLSPYVAGVESGAGDLH
jgi:hypothetical protein